MESIHHIRMKVAEVRRESDSEGLESDFKHICLKELVFYGIYMCNQCNQSGHSAAISQSLKKPQGASKKMKPNSDHPVAVCFFCCCFFHLLQFKVWQGDFGPL